MASAVVQRCSNDCLVVEDLADEAAQEAAWACLQVATYTKRMECERRCVPSHGSCKG